MASSFSSLSTGALLSLARCYWRQWGAPEKTALTALNSEERGASVGLQSEAMTAFESEWIAYETLGWWKRWRYWMAFALYICVVALYSCLFLCYHSQFFFVIVFVSGSL